MYVTEELLYSDEKFISREDDDGVIAHYNNVQLTSPAEDSHCIGSNVTYIWRVLLKSHCPLYHVRKFKEWIIKYDLPGLTIKTHKVTMSTDNFHVRFVIKGTKTECGQEFLVTNHPDLLIRDTNNYTLSSCTQEDGEEVVAPRYYIEPLTYRITSVAKQVPCLSQFFARYKDIFGQWFRVTPQISITEPPGTLDLESLQKKVKFDPVNDIDLSRGGVCDPDAVDDLITWTEGNCCQEVVVHQLADQVGNLNPGQYITPKLMFPLYTLPGGSWHTFI